MIFQGNMRLYFYCRSHTPEVYLKLPTQEFEKN